MAAALRAQLKQSGTFDEVRSPAAGPRRGFHAFCSCLGILCRPVRGLPDPGQPARSRPNGRRRRLLFNIHKLQRPARTVHLSPTPLPSRVLPAGGPHRAAGAGGQPPHRQRGRAPRRPGRRRRQWRRARRASGRGQQDRGGRGGGVRGREPARRRRGGRQPGGYANGLTTQAQLGSTRA